jgi:acylphosphatase
MKVIRHAIIRGHVQGVGFRFFVVQAVQRCLDRNTRIEGWVRNRRDGTVEALFVGEAEAVAAMLAACRKGPAGANVVSIDEREGDAAELELQLPDQAFSVLSTQ